MNIYVISLKNSPRRKIITSRLNDAGIAFEFVDAVNKEKISTENTKNIYDEDACRRKYGRALVAAEIACFMSHYKTWQMIVQTGLSGIVLEDDAILRPGFVLAFDVLKKKGSSVPDAILLGQAKLKFSEENHHYFHNPIFNKVHFDNLVIGNVFKLWTSGAVGYFLSNIGATKLVAANKIISCVADDWKQHSNNGLIVREARPYLVWEDFESMESYIESDRKKVTKVRGVVLDSLLNLARIVRALSRNLICALQRFKVE